MKAIGYIHKYIHWEQKVDSNWVTKTLSVFGLKIPFGKQQNLATVLNEYFDIRSCPPTYGKRRKLQMANTILLDIFDSICKKHNIAYYLDFGTLLGAVRHGGFIPWDDDIDVSVPREQYECLIDVLKTETKRLGLKLYGVDSVRCSTNVIRISLPGFESVNLDVFYPYCFNHDIKDRNKLIKIIRRYKWYWFVNWWEIEKNVNAKILKEFRDVVDSTFLREIGNAVDFFDPNAKVGCGQLYCINRDIFEMSMILPFSQISFEGRLYPAPSKPEEYLHCIYGDIYSFPATLSQHGSVFLDFAEEEVESAIGKLNEIRRNCETKCCSC